MPGRLLTWQRSEEPPGKPWRKGKFESDIDMSLSNSSIGADAPAAAFGKTACADFASVRYKNGKRILETIEYAGPGSCGNHYIRRR